MGILIIDGYFHNTPPFEKLETITATVSCIHSVKMMNRLNVQLSRAGVIGGLYNWAQSTGKFRHLHYRILSSVSENRKFSFALFWVIFRKILQIEFSCGEYLKLGIRTDGASAGWREWIHAYRNMNELLMFLVAFDIFRFLCHFLIPCLCAYLIFAS